MTDPILADLNPQQLEAVTAPDGPMLIVAGAGSGKTRVITRRIAHLVRNRGVHPGAIFAATFTNKAADEMRQRVAKMLGEHSPAAFHISTFHSMCARILRREHKAAGLASNFTICDERDQVSAIRHVIRQMGLSDKDVKPGDAQDRINQCKIRMLGPDDLAEASGPQDRVYAEVFEGYRDYLAANSALDFEDLIIRVVELLMKDADVRARFQERYAHVLVDEYQDINLVQFELVRLLAGGHQNLVVVGDEDQSIYSWRGADISYVQDFERHFPSARVLRLEQNYRSTGNILRAASVVIANNTRRHEKTLFTTGADGPPVYLHGARDDREEASAVVDLMAGLARRCGYRWGDMAIFYRVSALSRVFEDALRARNIPYRVVGGIRFYDRAEVKDVISYLQVVDNPSNSIALQRVINTPRRGIGPKSLSIIMDVAREGKISDFEAMCSAASRGMVPKAAAAKLLEFAGQVRGWRGFAESHPPSEVLKLVLEETGYIAALGDPDNMDVRSRTENIEELVSAVVDFERGHDNPTLRDYLENVSLVSPEDEYGDAESSASLMTLHAAKGLEFSVVFMVGMDDNIIPSPRALREASGKLNEGGGVEEERRLFYVGITRAREALFITRSSSRLWYGEVCYPSPSVFLGELPHDAVEFVRDPYSFDYYELSRRLRSDERGAAGPRPDAPPQDDHAEDDAPARPQHDADPEPPRQRSGKYHVGGRVRHRLLGEGAIEEVSGHGPAAKLTVRMEDGVCYTFLAKHANLQVLAD